MVLCANWLTRSFRLVCLIMISFLLSYGVVGQYYNSDSKPYDVSSGLPHNEINEIIQDDDGFVWIATDGGLSRYDGYNFITFNHSTHPSIFKNDRIIQLRKHRSLLYLLTETDGLIELNPKTISFRKVYTSNPRAIAFAHDTTVILFESGNLLCKVKNRLLFTRKFNVYRQSSIVVHQGKVVLSLNKNQLLLINPNSPKKTTKILLNHLDEPGNLCLSKKYGVVLWNGDVVRVLKGNSLIPHPDFLSQRGVSFFSEEYSGKYMLIERYRTPRVKFENVDLTLKLGLNKNLQFKSICRINEFCVLIATNQGVVRVYQVPSLSRIVNEDRLLSEDQVLVRRKIIEYQDKRYHLGFPFILVENENSVKHLTKRVLSTYDGIVFNGQLFCTTEGNGLVSIDLNSGKLTQITHKYINARETFESICRVSNTQLLLAGSNKVVVYNPTSKQSNVFYFENDLTIHVAIPSKNPHILLLGTNKGLKRVRVKEDGKIEKIDTYNAKTLDVRDILQRPKENKIWLATSQGVMVLDAKSFKLVRHYVGDNQVSNPKVVRLLEDKHGNIWAATYSGFTVYNSKKGTIYFVNKNHGVINTEFNYKSGCMMNSGNLVFGGLNAFEVIDPEVVNKFKYANSFTISGTEIIKNDKVKRFSSYTKGEPIQFNTGQEALNIYLTNLDYVFGGGYTFKYSLDSKTWFKVDQQNCILLSNLTYGEYTLKIRMYNPFGELAEEKAIQIFAIVPFYAKSSFLWIVIFLLVLMSILTILYFIRSIRIKAKTKSKIAMDLHDESGTILTRLLILVNREKFEHHEKEILKSGLKEALYSFRTYLDSISKTKCNWLELSDELKEFVAKSCNEVSIESEIDIHSDKNYQLKGELARDIKLLVYEIVTNSIKHSNAKHLTLKCTLKNNQLVLIISDSGECDLSDLEIFKGNGIRNLKKRAARNNGHLKYYISEGQTGLTVEVFLPLD